MPIGGCRSQTIGVGALHSRPPRQHYITASHVERWADDGGQVAVVCLCHRDPRLLGVDEPWAVGACLCASACSSIRSRMFTHAGLVWVNRCQVM